MNSLVRRREVRQKLLGDWVTGLSLLIIFLAIVIIFRAVALPQRDAYSAGNFPAAFNGLDAEESPDHTLVSEQLVAEGASMPEPHTAEVLVPELFSANTVDLLGVSIELRELRGSVDADGSIRNVEFFIREGILPRRLFSDASQVVVHYWPLYHNNVGYGATTVRILYQVITEDSNNDGLLDGRDRQSLAVSLPDGSRLRFIDGDAGQVVDMVYLSDHGELQVDFLSGGARQKRVYDLASGG